MGAANEYMDEVDRYILSLGIDNVQTKYRNAKACDTVSFDAFKELRESKVSKVQDAEDFWSDARIAASKAKDEKQDQNFDRVIEFLRLPSQSAKIMNEFEKERRALRKKSYVIFLDLRRAKEKVESAKNNKDKKKAIKEYKKFMLRKKINSERLEHVSGQIKVALKSSLLMFASEIELIDRGSLEKLKGFSREVKCDPVNIASSVIRGAVLIFSSLCELTSIHNMEVSDDDKKYMSTILKLMSNPEGERLCFPSSKDAEKYFFSRVDEVTKKYFQKSKVIIDELGSTELEFVSAFYRMLSALKNSLASMLPSIKLSPRVYNLGKQAHEVVERILAGSLDLAEIKNDSSLKRLYENLSSLDAIGFKLRYIVKIVSMLQKHYEDDGSKTALSL